MVKKILSIIILVMIICSTCVYGNDVIIPDGSSDVSQGQEETNTESSDSSNTNSGSSGEEDTNIGDNTTEEGTNNTGDNTTEEDNNTGNDNTENDTDNDINNETENENIDNGNGTDIGNEKDDKESNKDTSKEETPKKPVQNNSSTTNNTIENESSEARLKELKVDVEGLTPEFDKNTTEYYLIVDLTVEKVKVTANPVDNNAEVKISGNKNLKEGENTITISVEAEDGTTKEYYIYVTKIDNIELANAELESLEIDGFNIYPNFKSTIYSYNININESIDSLDVTAIPQMENAVVVIEGNTNLQEGENLIKVKVTAEDGTTIRTYKINTFIDSGRVEIEEESKIPAIILIVILGAGIIVLGVFIVIKNK